LSIAFDVEFFLRVFQILEAEIQLLHLRLGVEVDGLEEESSQKVVALLECFVGREEMGFILLGGECIGAEVSDGFAVCAKGGVGVLDQQVLELYANSLTIC
jgi:hypothetical protein